MKRALPIFLFVLVILSLAGAGVWAWKILTPPPAKDKVLEKIPPLSLEERPFVSLVPGPSCEHKFSISNIKDGVSQLEYEITYKDEKGVKQGVPGKIDLGAKREISRQVLFGTESSGHRRCDKGVNKGEIRIKYQDASGKLLADLVGKFHLQGDANVLTLDDFSLSLESALSGKSITMEGFGFPQKAFLGVSKGPYSVFAENSRKISGKVEIEGGSNLYGWNGEAWTELPGGKTTFMGTYVLVASK